MAKLIFTKKDILKLSLRAVDAKWVVYQYNTQLISVKRDSVEDIALRDKLAVYFTLNLWNGHFYIAHLVTKEEQTKIDKAIIEFKASFVIN